MAATVRTHLRKRSPGCVFDKVGILVSAVWYPDTRLGYLAATRPKLKAYGLGGSFALAVIMPVPFGGVLGVWRAGSRTATEMLLPEQRVKR